MFRRIRTGNLAGVIVLLFSLSYLGFTAFYASPNGVFNRYVVSPVPNSVTVHYVEANDYFLVNPEPVVRLAFSAPKETLDRILKSREATLYHRYAVGSAAGPGWFRPSISTNGLSQFQLKGDREFLWIDETGTNAFYLLFRV